MNTHTPTSREATGTRVANVGSGPVGPGVPAAANAAAGDRQSGEVGQGQGQGGGLDASAGLQDRLQKVLLWLRTAKENLPDLNNGRIPADRVAAASGLVDRLHRLALEATAQGSARGRRQRRAA